MKETQSPKPAATIILLRARQPSEFEVLLTQRRAAMTFLGGAYCFPGGLLREEDCSDRLLARSRGLTPAAARAIVGAHFAPRKALGLWLAAIRELFEEVGILLATTIASERISFDGTRITEIHAALRAKTLSFQTVLERENLLCDTARLAYFSHWQAHADSATGFDAHFFVAALPEDQTPLATSYGVAHSLWVTPDHALRLFDKSALPMSFSTFASLRTLADFDSLDRVFKEFRPRNGD